MQKYVEEQWADFIEIEEAVWQQLRSAGRRQTPMLDPGSGPDADYLLEERRSAPILPALDRRRPARKPKRLQTMTKPGSSCWLPRRLAAQSVHHYRSFRQFQPGPGTVAIRHVSSSWSIGSTFSLSGRSRLHVFLIRCCWPTPTVCLIWDPYSVSGLWIGPLHQLSTAARLPTAIGYCAGGTAGALNVPLRYPGGGPPFQLECVNPGRIGSRPRSISIRCSSCCLDLVQHRILAPEGDPAAGRLG
jgi:hypothetical protein